MDPRGPREVLATRRRRPSSAGVVHSRIFHERATKSTTDGARTVFASGPRTHSQSHGSFETLNVSRRDGVMRVTQSMEATADPRVFASGSTEELGPNTSTTSAPTMKFEQCGEVRDDRHVLNMVQSIREGFVQELQSAMRDTLTMLRQDLEQSFNDAVVEVREEVSGEVCLLRESLDRNNSRILDDLWSLREAAGLTSELLSRLHEGLGATREEVWEVERKVDFAPIISELHKLRPELGSTDVTMVLGEIRKVRAEFDISTVLSEVRKVKNEVDFSQVLKDVRKMIMEMDLSSITAELRRELQNGHHLLPAVQVELCQAKEQVTGARSDIVQLCKEVAGLRAPASDIAELNRLMTNLPIQELLNKLQVTDFKAGANTGACSVKDEEPNISRISGAMNEPIPEDLCFSISEVLDEVRGVKRDLDNKVVLDVLGDMRTEFSGDCSRVQDELQRLKTSFERLYSGFTDVLREVLRAAQVQANAAGAVQDFRLSSEEAQRSVVQALNQLREQQQQLDQLLQKRNELPHPHLRPSKDEKKPTFDVRVSLVPQTVPSELCDVGGLSTGRSSSVDSRPLA